jgi:CheY-like chemotaxis protein
MDRKILVVDDEASARQVLEEMLGASGYEVASAAGAGEALDILACEEINVIFLDLKLFGVSGIELCRKIRSMKPMAIVYAVTGWAALYEIEECREAGFDDFFTKPVNLDILRKAAADAFEKLDRWRKRY